MSGVETFVVRLARPDADAGGGAARELHGVAEQLRSKRSRAFRGNDELLRFLVEGLETGEQAEDERASSRVREENR